MEEPVLAGLRIPNNMNNNMQFGAVRDRLFHVMLVRFAVSGAGFSSIGDSDDSFWHYFLKPVEYNHESGDYELDDLSKNIAYEGPLVEDLTSSDDYIMYEYVVEYSLFFGVLRLPQSYRTEVGIPSMIVQLDADEEECFGDWTSRLLMKYFIGYEDVLLSSVKSLAINDSERGFVRDLRTGENYRFVTSSNTRWSTLTALLVMLIFANISVRAQNNQWSSGSPYHDALLEAGRRTADDVFERAYREALTSSSS
ncbi:hypothetical protein QR680_001397 [Steinernema hermaphroditum]|uniref:Uncharacterized protein n=1 Tax=Steinernema hermaphroditum TaxID=289476 RepID=A0AA39LFU7_9BILA|nr:hypothetical protein QR680_001397 [Steinernema hermaphroditum]